MLGGIFTSDEYLPKENILSMRNFNLVYNGENTAKIVVKFHSIKRNVLSIDTKSSLEKYN